MPILLENQLQKRSLRKSSSGKIKACITSIHLFKITIQGKLIVLDFDFTESGKGESGKGESGMGESGKGDLFSNSIKSSVCF